MKKLLMLAALSVFGTSFAAGTVNVTVNATVSNTCVFQGTSTDAKTGTVSSTLTTLTYNALNGGNVSGTAYVVQCTKGTSFTSGSKGSNQALNLTSAANGTLATTFSDSLTTDSTQSGMGDIHTMSVTVTAAASQWDVEAGTYTGTITYSVDYN